MKKSGVACVLGCNHLPVCTRTGQDIPNDVIYQLATHPNFLGVKECTGNERIQVLSHVSSAKN